MCVCVCVCVCICVFNYQGVSSSFLGHLQEPPSIYYPREASVFSVRSSHHLLWEAVPSSRPSLPSLCSHSCALFCLLMSLFPCLFLSLERAPWGQELSLGGFYSSSCGTTPGILYVLSTYLRDEGIYPHNYKLVYFNNIATENTHPKSKTPKGLIVSPARSHWENHHHIDPSDFLIAGQFLWAGFAYLCQIPMWELAQIYRGSFDPLSCPVCPQMGSWVCQTAREWVEITGLWEHLISRSGWLWSLQAHLKVRL